MIEYRIKQNIYNRNEQRLNTNIKIYNSNEGDRIKIFKKYRIMQRLACHNGDSETLFFEFCIL